MREKSYKTGYFKSPDFIFDLPISPLAKLLLVYFCRRSDKSGISFPSIERISKDTGIKSHTSIRKYIRELIENDQLRILEKGKEGVSNRYQLSESIVNIVLTNKEKTECITPSKFDYPTTSDPEPTPSNYDYPPPNFDGIPRQNMTPKEYSVKENTNKENTSAENEKIVFDAEGSQDIYISFSAREKEYGDSPTPSREFDIGENPAPALQKQTLPKPSPVSDEPTPRVKLTRQAADLLLRRAQGEEVDLSDIYREFDKLKIPNQ
ncbi:MAG: helix-turn-helix domain-containing protein [Thermodesulfobacteriota bacterium]